MSLIKCPECGKEISDKVHACIYCGYPLAEISRKPQEIICTCCGATNPSSSDYCEQCGMRITPYNQSGTTQEQYELEQRQIRKEQENLAYEEWFNSLSESEKQTELMRKLVIKQENTFSNEGRILKMNVCTKCKTTYDGAFCPNCGTPANQTPPPTYPAPPQKQGNSALGILALIFSILGCTFFVAIILAIIDLCKKDGRKKSLSIAALVISGIWLLGGIGNIVKKDNVNTTTIASVEESPIPTETPAPTQNPGTDSLEPSAEPQENIEDSMEMSEESTENTEEEAITPEEPVISEDDFKASCQQFNYKTIARNPDDYIGQNFVVDVKISQKVNGKWYSDYDIYYKAYTNDKYDMWLGDFLYIIDRQDKDADNYLNVLEDDIIRVYGTFNGMSESKNVLTGTTSNDVSLDMKYCELISE